MKILFGWRQQRSNWVQKDKINWHVLPVFLLYNAIYIICSGDFTWKQMYIVIPFLRFYLILFDKH